LVVGVVLVDDKVPIVPLEIMGDDVDLTRVVLREGIQPFEKISDTLFSLETKGPIVVFGFGHDEIGHVLFLGLQGLDVKKHVEGWHVILVFVHVFLLLFLLQLIGSQGLKTRGSTPFGARTSLSRAFAFLLLLLLSDFLRSEGSLNVAAMGLGVHVLVLGRTFDVPTTMTLIVLEPHFQLGTGRTSASTRADGVLMAGRGFSRVVFGAMGLVTSISKNVAMTVMATSGGFESPWVGMKEIGALFLETGVALDFFVVVWTSMTSYMVIGFQAVGTHVTGPPKPRETGDDIIMVFLVEQDQLFGLGGSESCYVEGTVCVHQDDLVVVEGGGGTGLRQLFVPARTWRDVSFVMELQS